MLKVVGLNVEDCRLRVFCVPPFFGGKGCKLMVWRLEVGRSYRLTEDDLTSS
jgi:hypothetical protein